MTYSRPRPRRLGIVLTGGTIGSVITGAGVDTTVRLAEGEEAQSPLDLLGSDGCGLSAASEKQDSADDDLHPLQNIDVRTRRPVSLLSENLLPQDWPVIASAVRDLVEEESVEGVLVLHGTDTMTYTAAALSFLLADLTVPVVLTGSNFPPDLLHSDAPRNVKDSVVALQHLDAGVFIVFAGDPTADGWVHLGTCARKVCASGSAFETVNGAPVGRVSGSEFVACRAFSRPKPLPRAGNTIDPRVLAVRLYPGLDFHAVLAAIIAGDIQGVIIELYPCATGPNLEGRYSLPRFVVECRKRDIAVFTTLAATPAASGHCYESGLASSAAGAILLPNMLPETAVVKLMWALAQSGPSGITELMLAEVCSEFSGHR